MLKDDYVKDRSRAEFSASMRVEDLEEQGIPFRQLSTVSECDFVDFNIVKK